MIKRLILMLSLLIALASCGGNRDSSASTEISVKDHVEVIYFHGKQRCPTCMAIEKNTREVIEETFADEIRKGTLVFKIAYISTNEGEALADRYEVTWSSLFVNKWKDGKETRNNMTEFGFGSARKKPQLFRQGLIQKIRESLK